MISFVSTSKFDWNVSLIGCENKSFAFWAINYCLVLRNLLHESLKDCRQVVPYIDLELEHYCHRKLAWICQTKRFQTHYLSSKVWNIKAVPIFNCDVMSPEKISDEVSGSQWEFCQIYEKLGRDCCSKLWIWLLVFGVEQWLFKHVVPVQGFIIKNVGVFQAIAANFLLEQPDCTLGWTSDFRRFSFVFDNIGLELLLSFCFFYEPTETTLNYEVDWTSIVFNN